MLLALSHIMKIDNNHIFSICDFNVKTKYLKIIISFNNAKPELR